MDILDDLPAEMERVQRTCSQASRRRHRARYFAGAVATAWSVERR